jgi:hypothetical protein
VEKVTGLTAQHAAEVLKRLERRVLGSILQPVQRRATDLKRSCHFDLAESGVLAHSPEGLGESSRKVHNDKAWWEA